MTTDSVLGEILEERRRQRQMTLQSNNAYEACLPHKRIYDAINYSGAALGYVYGDRLTWLWVRRELRSIEERRKFLIAATASLVDEITLMDDAENEEFAQ